MLETDTYNYPLWVYIAPAFKYYMLGRIFKFSQNVLVILGLALFIPK